MLPKLGYLSFGDLPRSVARDRRFDRPPGGENLLSVDGRRTGNKSAAIGVLFNDFPFGQHQEGPTNPGPADAESLAEDNLGQFRSRR